jgi:hypothetical protein
VDIFITANLEKISYNSLLDQMDKTELFQTICSNFSKLRVSPPLKIRSTIEMPSMEQLMQEAMLCQQKNQ